MNTGKRTDLLYSEVIAAQLAFFTSRMEES